MATLKEARALVYSLGLPLYFDSQTGRVTQHGPGERIEVPAGGTPFPSSEPPVKAEVAPEEPK